VPSINPLSKNITASRFQLASDSFDIANFQPGGAGNQSNDTLSADTPKGVLGGAVAATDLGNDWQSAIAAGVTHDTPITGRGNQITLSLPALGLYSDNSEGNAFENSPAAASGTVGIFMTGGLFELFVFETHTAADVIQLAAYTIGAPLFVSPYGLITVEAPTVQDGVAGLSAGIDVILANVTKAPTATDLSIGLKLLV